VKLGDRVQFNAAAATDSVKLNTCFIVVGLWVAGDGTPCADLRRMDGSIDTAVRVDHLIPWGRIKARSGEDRYRRKTPEQPRV
jgi:hypothetical protein